MSSRGLRRASCCHGANLQTSQWDSGEWGPAHFSGGSLWRHHGSRPLASLGPWTWTVINHVGLGVEAPSWRRGTSKHDDVVAPVIGRHSYGYYYVVLRIPAIVP